MKPDNWFWFLMLVSAVSGGGWKFIAAKFGLSLQISFHPDFKDKEIARLKGKLVEKETEKSNVQALLDLTRAQNRDDVNRLERENDSLCNLLTRQGTPEQLIRRAREVAALPDPQRPRLNSGSDDTTNRKEQEPN